MGVSKTDAFSAQQNEMALLFKALAHPARIAIVQYLLKHPTCICGAIVDELPLSQATVSQHLKELKLAGLIQGSIEGNAICYCLNPSTLERVKDYVSLLVNDVSASPSCC